MNPNEFFKRSTGPRVLKIDNVDEVHLAEDDLDSAHALGEPNFLKRLDSLLNSVVLRLPEEEQFWFSGAFLFHKSSQESQHSIWKDFDKVIPETWKKKISSSKFMHHALGGSDLVCREMKDENSPKFGYCTYEFDLDDLAERDPDTTEFIDPSSLTSNIKLNLKHLEDSPQNWVPFYVVTIMVDNLPSKSDDYIIGLIAYELSVMSRAWQIMKKGLKGIDCWKYLDRKNIKKEAKRLGFGKEIDALEAETSTFFPVNLHTLEGDDKKCKVCGKRMSQHSFKEQKKWEKI